MQGVSQILHSHYHVRCLCHSCCLDLHKCTVSPGTTSLQPLVELPALLQAGETE